MLKEPKIVRVSSTEFELDDGRIFPHVEELEKVPSIEEFQKLYDQWSKIIRLVDGKVS